MIGVRVVRMRSVPFRSRMRSFRASVGVGRRVEGWREVERYSASGTRWVCGGAGVGERRGLKVGVE